MQEIDRQLVDGKIVITYADGSKEVLDNTVPTTPSDHQFDADSDESINSGHVFSEEELADA